MRVKHNEKHTMKQADIHAQVKELDVLAADEEQTNWKRKQTMTMVLRKTEKMMARKTMRRTRRSCRLSSQSQSWKTMKMMKRKSRMRRMVLGSCPGSPTVT